MHTNVWGKGLAWQLLHNVLFYLRVPVTATIKQFPVKMIYSGWTNVVILRTIEMQRDSEIVCFFCFCCEKNTKQGFQESAAVVKLLLCKQNGWNAWIDRHQRTKKNIPLTVKRKDITKKWKEVWWKNVKKKSLFHAATCYLLQHRVECPIIISHLQMVFLFCCLYVRFQWYFGVSSCKSPQSLWWTVQWLTEACGQLS